MDFYKMFKGIYIKKLNIIVYKSIYILYNFFKKN